MKIKRLWTVGLAATILVACGNSAANPPAEKTAQSEETSQNENADLEQTITYLGETYTLPTEINNIITASLESMEDAAMLGVKPAGALTVAGELPTYLADDLEGATSIGEKMEPNYETILTLKPDIILGSSKFQDEVREKLNKIGTMIPVSHISSNWKDNLLLMGVVAGKTAEAEDIISKYEADVAASKEKIDESILDEDVLIIRVRGGSLFVYPADVYLNPVLYEDLGFVVPDMIQAAQAQEEISLETLAELNPVALFLQFEKSENDGDESVLEDVLENPIFQSIDAVKSDQLFINTVDPMAQGGTVWSKEKFLHAAVDNLAES